MNNIDPVRDIEFLETEFLFYDLAFLDGRIAKLEKEIMKTKDDKLKRELPVIEKCFAHVEAEKPLRSLELSDDDLKLLSGYQLRMVLSIPLGGGRWVSFAFVIK